MALFLLGHHGIIDGVEEEFVHTLAVTSEATATNLAIQARSDWMTAWTDSSIGLQSFTGGGIHYTHVTAAPVLGLTAPNERLGAAARSDFTPPLDATGGGYTAPQLAVAVSLTAGTYPNGVPVRGRFYLPPLTASGISQGRLSQVLQDQVLDFASNYLDRLTSLTIIPSVWSRGAPRHGAPLGFFATVSRVLVGDRVDTIRSRRNDQREVYVSIPVPSVP